MSLRNFIIIIILILSFSGCSNTRFIPDNQLLYTGRDKVEIIELESGAKNSTLKPYVKSLTEHKVNNALLGHRILPPIGLWVYNYWNPDEEKKFGSWVYKTLSASPVLVSQLNPELKSKVIESELFDQGYFNIKAWAVVDTSSRSKKKGSVSYFVQIAPPFVYDQIGADTARERIDTIIAQHNVNKHIKPGGQYNLEAIKQVRNEISRAVQNQGYFYFTPDFITMTADTSTESHTINLSIGREKDLSEGVLSTYTIDDILIHIRRSSDSPEMVTDTAWTDDIQIVSTGDYLNLRQLAESVFFRRGELYSRTKYRSTISRLNGLGVFAYVGLSIVQSEADSLLQVLDMKIDLIMADNINLDFEADLVNKSTGYTGPQMAVEVSHNNAFKGAEKIHIGLKGGLEWQWGSKSESELGTFSYDLGVSSGLTFPRIILPGNSKRIRRSVLQQTAVNLDFNLLNRTAYYQMFSSKANLNYNWSRNKLIQHSFFPVYINSVNLLNTTADFDSVVNENIYIRKSFEEQFIFGMKYEFTFDNRINSKQNNVFFQQGIHTSGNAIDFFAGMAKESSERPYLFLDNIYAQFVKFTSDFRYYRRGLNNTLVFRLYAGTGIPYGNSSVLPYVEQFYSGGAYSVRGFTARYLGPGSYFMEDNSGYIDQSGDLKLESNLEYRFRLSKILNGAIFLETGNIWLINEDENRPGAAFNVNTFYDQLAVGTGVGLRFDFSFFVLRTDLGFPLRTPYLSGDRHWLFGTGDVFSGALFYLAVGYPF